jgi:hypothetical protein
MEKHKDRDCGKTSLAFLLTTAFFFISLPASSATVDRKKSM